MKIVLLRVLVAFALCVALMLGQMLGATFANAAIVTFNYSGTVISSFGVGAPSVGSTSQASMTFDTSAVGAPFLPGIVDYNDNSLIGFSIDSVAYSSALGSGIRMFDNYQQGSNYFDGMQASAGSAARVNFSVNLLNVTSAPSLATTSINLPTTPFDPSLFNSTHVYSYTVFQQISGGGSVPAIQVAVDITSASLAPSPSHHMGNDDPRLRWRWLHDISSNARGTISGLSPEQIA